MVMSNAKYYEALREQRLEENKKRMEELHLPLLSQSLHNASPKSSPMKKTKRRIARNELVPVRRSQRFSKKTIAQYKEVTFYERVQIPRRITHHRTRDLSGRVYASDEARECAIKKAEELESTLGSEYQTFVRSMLPSHVTGGFWLGLSTVVCKRTLPRSDGVIHLVDEQGEEWPIIYLARKCGLSGGWKKFAIDHDLVDGDALVFQLIKPSVFKVFIIRGDDSGKNVGDEMNKIE